MTFRTCTTHWRESTAALLLATLLVGGCDSRSDAPPRTEQRGVDVFHSVDLRGGNAEVSVEVGPAASVAITADSDTLSHIITEVHNGMLVVDHRDGRHWFRRSPPVQLRITLPVLNAFAVNGAGDVTIRGVHGDALALVLQGAGNLVASGETKSLNARINGAGNLDLAGLRAGDATVAVNGAGHLNTQVTGSLVAELNGVGSIEYAGKPQQVETRINGVGSIAPVSASGT